MEDKEKSKYEKFMDKYALLVLFAGVIAFMVILKLIGFPEIMSK